MKIKDRSVGAYGRGPARALPRGADVARLRLGVRRGLPPRPWRRCLRWLPALSQDLGDPNEGELLAMPALTPRILAAALFEGDDLRAAHMIEYLGTDSRTRNGRSAQQGVLAANREDFAKFYNRAGRSIEPIDLEHVFRGNAILLAARFDDREHLFGPCVRTRCSDLKGRPPTSRNPKERTPIAG